MIRIDSLEVTPLSIPLLEPFVIASGRIDVTRAALVEVVLLDEATGARAHGLGEAAALPPVTREDQPELLRTIGEARLLLLGIGLGDEPLAAMESIASLLDSIFDDTPVARAGVEMALLDALARLTNVSVRVLLGGALGGGTRTLVTDITLPIFDVLHTAELAKQWRARGFTAFKVKVGQDLLRDLAALAAISEAVPDAVLRIDANAGFSASNAIRLLSTIERLGVRVECFEQPCGEDDLDGMALVTAASRVPVIADESVRSLDDLARVRDKKAAHGVNLKIAKSGGLLPALAIGRQARAQAMPIMCGGMIETRLGMTAAAHVAAALGGVDFVDLDTAWLLASDPFEGGYTAEGPHMTLVDDVGLGVRRARGDAT